MNRIWFSFARRERLRYISHLDMLRLFIRALRRGRFSLAYSKGFNPHPRFSLALPLPLGVAADDEMGEVFLTVSVDTELFVRLLAAQMPEGVEITGAVPVEQDRPPLPSLVEAASYRAVMINEGPEHISGKLLKRVLENLLSSNEIIIFKSSKKKRDRKINIRPHILSLSTAGTADRPAVDMLLQTGSGGGVAPLTVLEKITAEMGISDPNNVRWNLRRERLYAGADGKLEPLSEGMCKIDG